MVEQILDSTETQCADAAGSQAESIFKMAATFSAQKSFAGVQVETKASRCDALAGSISWCSVVCRVQYDA